MRSCAKADFDAGSSLSATLPPVRILLDHLAHGVLVLDEAGTILHLSDAARSLLPPTGTAPVELEEGVELSEARPDLVEGSFGGGLEQVVRRGGAVLLPPEPVPDAGLYRQLHLAALPGGTVLVEVRDVTAEVRRASELDHLVQRYPFGAVTVLDRQLRYLRVGGQGLEAAGLDAGSLVGLPLQEAWPPEVVEQLMGPYAAALEGEESEIRVRYRGRDYIVWVGPFRAPSGRVEGVLALTWDVSEHVRTRAEYRLIEEAVSQLHLGVSIADARADDEPLIYVNDGFVELTGYPREEVIGRNCRFLQGPDTDPESVELLRRAVHRGEAVQVTMKNYRKGGEPFWNRLSIFPVRQGEDDTLTHFVGIQEDVSRQRAMGRELAERERLSAVGQLAGGVAHDIRNVLMGAGGLLELNLDRDDLPEETRSDLREAREVLSRAKTVTDQLLVFARDTPLERGRVDLRAVLERRSDFFRSVLRENVRLRMELPDDPVAVALGEGQVDQILINLLKNSEHAIAGDGTITVSLTTGPDARAPFTELPEEDVSGVWARLTVRDTGHGMDDETRRRATEPFFTTREERQGTGLGLSTVYGVVTQAGGSLAIDSAPGEGTSVHLGLPVLEEVEEVEEELPEPEGSEGTVLLVEDDPTVRRACGRYLENHGYRVISAPDGDSGMRAFERARDQGRQVDLLLTDAVMPSVSGPELADRLREEDPDLPVVIMTGYTPEELDRDGRLGGYRYLNKPFELDELGDVVAREIRS